MSAGLDDFPGPYRAVLFDLDGTLAHLRVDWDAVRRDLSAALPPSGGDGEAIPGIQAQIARAANVLGEEAKRIAASVIAAHEISADVDPIPEGLALFRRARGAAKTGVVSNNQRATVLRALGLLGIQAEGLAVVGYDDVSRIKPDPEGLLAVLSRLGVPAEAALYVGDAATDRLAAQAAGMAFYPVDFPATFRG